MAMMRKQQKVATFIPHFCVDAKKYSLVFLLRQDVK